MLTVLPAVPIVTALVVPVALVLALNKVWVVPPPLPDTVSVAPPASPSAKVHIEEFVPPDRVVDVGPTVRPWLSPVASTKTTLA